MNLQKPNYRTWRISQHDFPTRGNMRQKIAFLAGYGVLAPSQHNTQPWLFEIKGSDTLIIKPDRTKTLPVADPSDRGLYIALGMCTENIVQAGEQFGLRGSVTVHEGVVWIRFEEATPSNATAAANITGRHSNKRVYLSRKIDAATLDKLALIQTSSVELKLITDAKTLRAVAHIHLSAAATVAGNHQFVRELTNWLRPNKTRSFDGMPGFVTGMPALKSLVSVPLLRKKPELFKKALRQEEKLFSSAPLVAVWGAKRQTANEFIECGKVIERFWLEAVQSGLAAHPLTAAISDESASRQLAGLTGMRTAPVFLMRVGYHKDTGLRTPRKAAACN